MSTVEQFTVGPVVPTDRTPLARVRDAARLHLIGWQSIVIPYSVMFSALVVNLLIFGLLRARGIGPDEAGFTGGLFSLYITVALVFVSAMNRQMAFALDFSLTRRAYLLGTALFAVGLSLASALALYLMRLLESATGGFWMDLGFFAVGGWDTGDPVTQVLGYAAPMLAVSGIGALFGAVYARWGTIGTYAALILLAFAIGLFVVGVTYAEAWESIGDWFVDQPMAALLAGYPLVIAAVCGAGAYAVCRRVKA